MEPLPVPVVQAIQHTLGAPARFMPVAGGTNRRTFLVRGRRQHWVARAEPAPAVSLLRAIDAQTRADLAGVRVPRVIAHDLTPTEHGPFFWSVETYMTGRPFDHDSTDTPTAQTAIMDLGRQLRCLHAVQVDAFGDLPPRPYPVYPSFEGWVANKARRIPAAAQLAGQPTSLVAEIEGVYRLLAGWYHGAPALCKGDCAYDNLLVDGAGHVAIIDWEWAQGLDPAGDIAFWCRATPDPRAHELLLAAYGPDEPDALRRRVWAHTILQAIETIHVFDEHHHAFNARERERGIETEWAALSQQLRHMPG